MSGEPGVGLIGTIDNSGRAVYGYDQRVEVFGSGGLVRNGDAYPNSVVLSTGEGVRRDPPWRSFLDRYGDRNLTQLRASVVVGLAARRSHDEGWSIRLA